MKKKKNKGLCKVCGSDRFDYKMWCESCKQYTIYIRCEDCGEKTEEKCVCLDCEVAV